MVKSPYPQGCWLIISSHWIGSWGMNPYFHRYVGTCQCMCIYMIDRCVYIYTYTCVCIICIRIHAPWYYQPFGGCCVMYAFMCVYIHTHIYIYCIYIYIYYIVYVLEIYIYHHSIWVYPFLPLSATIYLRCWDWTFCDIPWFRMDRGRSDSSLLGRKLRWWPCCSPIDLVKIPCQL